MPGGAGPAASAAFASSDATPSAAADMADDAGPTKRGMAEVVRAPESIERRRGDETKLTSSRRRQELKRVMYNFPHVPEARAVSSAPGECSRVSTSTMPRDMPSTTREFAQLEESMAHERKCVPLEPLVVRGRSFPFPFPSPPDSSRAA